MQSKVREALLALAPRGTRKDIIAALGRPITWGALRHWMTGRKPVPQWAADRIRQHMARYDLSAAVSKHERRGQYLRAYEARRARERDEQARKEKGAV